MKKDKKNSVVRADLLRGVCAGAMVLLAMIGYADPGPVPLVLALIVFLTFLAVELLLNRCPHCGRYLDRNWGHFCQHCGERIRGEEADT